MSADNPLAERKSLSLKHFLDAAHVIVTVLQGEQSAVDRRLTKLGHHRNAALTVPYHSAALLAVPGTRLVATLPERMLVDSATDPAVRVMTAPKRSRPCPTRWCGIPASTTTPPHGGYVIWCASCPSQVWSRPAAFAW